MPDVFAKGLIDSLFPLIEKVQGSGLQKNIFFHRKPYSWVIPVSYIHKQVFLHATPSAIIRLPSTILGYPITIGTCGYLVASDLRDSFYLFIKISSL
ncbi:MAG: hypothetical protein Ct9H90mP4_03090 [Gammaproteobacteria bacterium]|nr:MAG: hypothetical protein Ct9H90mP4_03090 [Gammaproteobacteria bacterium]